MRRKTAASDHLARFALRWLHMSNLRKEKVTLILSPHLDDIFLSLYATIVSGKIGSNIVGVNFFTSTDSMVSTNVKTSFATVAKTSAVRIREELAFANVLQSQGINYIPVFLGLQDASVSAYYSFMAGNAMGRLAKGPMKGAALAALRAYDKLAENYFGKIGLGSLLDPLLRQFKPNTRFVLAPLGVGTHIDHSAVSRFALRLGSVARLGLYAEIPYVYMSGNITINSLRARAPRGFTDLLLTEFDPREKNTLFRKLYPSQYEKRIGDAVSAVGKGLGEAIFWKRAG